MLLSLANKSYDDRVLVVPFISCLPALLVLLTLLAYSSPSDGMCTHKKKNACNLSSRGLTALLDDTVGRCKIHLSRAPLSTLKVALCFRESRPSRQ